MALSLTPTGLASSLWMGPALEGVGHSLFLQPVLSPGRLSASFPGRLPPHPTAFLISSSGLRLAACY